MARHKLTVEEQLRGVQLALKNPKTPRHFRAGLVKREHELARKLGKGRGKKRFGFVF